MVIGGYTIVPNPFWGGALFPLVIIGFLYFWPALERKWSGDYGWHNVIERPRDNPRRTAVGVGVVSWVLLVFVAGSSDRVNLAFGISYVGQIWFYRFFVFVGPLLLAAVTYRICKGLQAGEKVERDRHKAEAEARLATWSKPSQSSES